MMLLLFNNAYGQLHVSEVDGAFVITDANNAAVILNPLTAEAIAHRILSHAKQPSSDGQKILDNIDLLSRDSARNRLAAGDDEGEVFRSINARRAAVKLKPITRGEL